MSEAKSYFFCGIGGSGMLPLAMIVRGAGRRSRRLRPHARPGPARPTSSTVSRAQGIALFPQDGSGVTSADQILVASAAVEETRARRRRGATRSAAARMTRAELLAALFNAAPTRHRGRRHQRQIDRHRHDRLDPARGGPRSDGDERRGDEEFRHARRALRQRAGRQRRRVSSARSTKATARSRSTGRRSRCSTTSRSTTRSLDELRHLFRRFRRARRRRSCSTSTTRRRGCWPPRCRPKRLLTFGFDDEARTSVAAAMVEAPLGVSFDRDRTRLGDDASACRLQVPGRHNAANALAAIAAAHAAGVPLAEAAEALASFTGLRRRFERGRRSAAASP